MPNFVPMKHVDIGQAFIENFISAFASVIQVYRRILHMEANSAATESDGLILKSRRFPWWAGTKFESGPPRMPRG